VALKSDDLLNLLANGFCASGTIYGLN